MYPTKTLFSGKGITDTGGDGTLWQNHLTWNFVKIIITISGLEQALKHTCPITQYPLHEIDSLTGHVCVIFNPMVSLSLSLLYFLNFIIKGWPKIDFIMLQPQEWMTA